MTSIPLRAYLTIGRIAEPAVRRWLKRRAARGKEDPARLGERFGTASQVRPEGRLVWFHAASVGESLSILDLITKTLDSYPRAHVLVTSGTVTSANLLAKRLPARAIHQYIPVDLHTPVRRFLDHWKPDLAIFTESEFWPTTLLATVRHGIPLALVNGRMSEKSARGWRRARHSIADLLGSFDVVLTQDDATRDRLAQLGAHSAVTTGSLKEGAAPLGFDQETFETLHDVIGSRPVWIAASTHFNEEDIAADAHREVRLSQHDALLVLVPRHPNRAVEIANRLHAQNWSFARRTEGALPGIDTEIYLADTLGELGLWYRLATVAFVGGSLVPIGGHNPFEPAALGTAIVHGPFIGSFADGYARLASADAACRIEDGEELGAAIARLLNPEESARLAAAAWELFSEGAMITDRVFDALQPLYARTLE